MLFQWNYDIEGLIPKQVRLRRKLWLKKGEILLEKKDEKMHAYVLGNESDRGERRIESYLWMSSLISQNTPEISGGSGASILTPTELGTRPVLYTTMEVIIQDSAVRDIEQYAFKFISFIRNLHNKYIDIVNDNDFLALSIEYFYESEKKSIYSSKGFISAMISLETLFNEGPSDIKYKLAHRAAFLLGLTGLDSIEVFEKLKIFYNHRSTLVHGGVILKHDSDRHLVSKYTRRVLIIVMILLRDMEWSSKSGNKRKIEILKEIDYAMLDEQRKRILRKIITKGLRDFKLNIPRTFEGQDDGNEYRVTAW